MYAIAASSAPWAIPTACAPIVGRVWSRVASAVLNPVPGSPMIRSPGMRQSSKYSSVVGDPLMPSLRSFGPDGEPRIVLVHDERRDAVGALVRVGHRHHRVPGRVAAVGDPALGAVEDPVVAVATGAGAHRRRVAARLTFGQRIRRHRLAGRDRRQHLLLQLLASRASAGPWCPACCRSGSATTTHTPARPLR